MTAETFTGLSVTVQRVGYRQLAQLGALVSDRDRSVLGTLAALRYATTRQLQRLWFDPAASSPLAAARAAQRCLARLHRLGVADRIGRRIGGVRAGSAGYVWRLTPAGARLIDANPARRRGEPGLQALAHDLDVAELVVSLHEHARTSPGVGLVGIETEPECWRSYTRPPNGRGWIKPDLRVTLATGGYDLHWFIEVDRGTEGHSALVRKIGGYLGAWRDGGEQAAAGCFPRVLWVTPDPGRAERIAQICADTPGVPAGMFATTTTARAIATLTRGSQP